MAENYLQFCFAVPRSNREVLTNEQQKWVADRLCFLGELDDGSDWSVEEARVLAEEMKSWELVKKLKDEQVPLGFRWELDDNVRLVIWAEDWGDINHVALFLIEYIKRWCPEETIGFEFSRSCSRPRLDEFGGGAVLITANGYDVRTTATLLTQSCA